LLLTTRFKKEKQDFFKIIFRIQNWKIEKSQALQLESEVVQNSKNVQLSRFQIKIIFELKDIFSNFYCYIEACLEKKQFVRKRNRCECVFNKKRRKNK